MGGGEELSVEYGQMSRKGKSVFENGKILLYCPLFGGNGQNMYLFVIWGETLSL